LVVKPAKRALIVYLPQPV